MNRVEVGKELENVIDKLNFTLMVLRMIPSVTLSKRKKPEMIKMLISFRKRYFDLDQRARSRIKSSVRKDFPEKYSSFALYSHLEDLYSNSIYCLSE